MWRQSRETKEMKRILPGKGKQEPKRPRESRGLRESTEER